MYIAISVNSLNITFLDTKLLKVSYLKGQTSCRCLNKIFQLIQTILSKTYYGR